MSFTVEAGTTRLRLPHYLGYASGDAANNLAFSMTSLFLLVYYTDVVGLSAAAAGTLFLLIRIWDAFADVFAGRVVDATMTRWGKFRPFFLFGAVPLMLLSVATFSVPALAEGGTALLLAYLTYGLLGLVYSLVNIPYGSLASAMTQVPEERGRLAGYRMIGTASTMILLALVVAPQIEQFRGDPDGLQSSLLVTTGLFAVVGVVLYAFLFRTATEQVPRTVDRVSLRQSLATLRRNRPLIILCVASLLFLCGMFAQTTAQVYYARDVLQNANYVIVLTLLSSGAIFLIAPFIPWVIRTFGKQPGFVGFGAIGVVGGVVISLGPPSVPAVPLIGFGLVGVGVAGVNTLMWALEADTVEYGEWRTGVRTEGTTYALFSFTRKLGQAVGGAAAAYAIAFGGYVANTPAQSEAAIWWITAAAGLLPAVFILLGIVVFLRYPLTEATFATMVEQTRARRPGNGDDAEEVNRTEAR